MSRRYKALRQVATYLQMLLAMKYAWTHVLILLLIIIIIIIINNNDDDDKNMHSSWQYPARREPGL